jgi:hypothetical protein
VGDGPLLNEPCISIYPYASEEPGDLNFAAGALITVTGKAGDWWTGRLADGTQGVFPFNYVEPAPQVRTNRRAVWVSEYSVSMPPRNRALAPMPV